MAVDRFWCNLRLAVTGARDWLVSDNAALIMRLGTIMALIMAVFVGFQQHTQQECFKRYAEAQAIATRARAEAGEVDRRAQDMLFVAVASNPRQSIHYIRLYNEARAETDRQRAANPLPAPPSATC